MMYEHPSELVRIDTRKRMMKMDRRRSASMREREEKLETVDLSGKNLERLPTNPSFNLGIIFKLDLSNNNLQMIPESLIARLLNVVVLDVHSNQLKYLPNSIGCLSKLKILNVAGNNLESLPKTIENCSSLEELNANFNRLTRLPDTIGFELTNLKKLIVSSNKLVSLPVSTGHLTSLYHLDVRLNCLQSLPEDLENLTNLQILNVSQNFHHLKTLPYSIGLLLSLVELDISYNNITTLPDSMSCLGKLKELRVEGNPLVSPPPVVVEQGLEAMKMYLTEKMNNGHRSPGRAKKTTWIKKLIKYGSFSGGCTAYRKHDESVKFVPCKSYNSQKDVGIFSPWRLFSPKSHHSS